ncbi:MAG TPA: sulfotransferase [Steroidobacteraceae bacterium]|nr:sulfotransferase [Steroidobacteraceae bacterium]
MQSTTLTPAASPIEAQVSRIRTLLERNQIAAALAAAEALLEAVPENRDVLYMIAVSQRHLQRIPEALATLARLESHHPRFSRLYQERGHCHVAARDAPRAIEAFLAGVNRNPALPASWRALQTLYRMTAQTANAEMAGRHVATLAQLPVEIVTASAMFAEGELILAERMVRDYLLKHGNHVEAMRLLARIGIELDVADDAELLLDAVLELAPDYHPARYDLVLALLKRHKHARARCELDKLLQADPGNRAYRTTYATVCVGLGDHEQALTLYRQLLSEAPRAAAVCLSVAHTLKTLGRQQEAIDAYRAAAALKPNYGDAYWSLANLKTYRFTDDEIIRMRVEEAAPRTQLADRYHLCFALGKALEDRAEYAESFVYYERGNRLKKSESHYQPQAVELNAALQAAVCTREFFAARQGVGFTSAAPIFIVGLPRSGSTLLEQILASHSEVEGTMELADIPRLVHELQGRDADESNPRYPGVLAQLGAADCRRFGERYLADTKIYRTGKAVFIDKMPNNFRHIGLIHLILPNAKIIDARRAAVACCFGNFKQLFASGQEFTYGLEDIGRYYRSYVQLMDHWNEALPGKILRVQHEDLVGDFEANVRRMLDFVGLNFEPACLQFYKTERSVRTASSEQVRQPIFKEGLDQWRHFEPWLGPLQAALGSLLEAQDRCNETNRYV